MFLVSSVCFAGYGTIGFKLQKTVNDGYEISVPTKSVMVGAIPFAPTARFEFTPYFTAPRGNFNLSAFNHSRMDVMVSEGITVLGWRGRFGTGVTDWLAGNNEGVPAGLVWCNFIELEAEIK